jgi:membrane-associated phospholipid phosphatase
MTPDVTTAPARAGRLLERNLGAVAWIVVAIVGLSVFAAMTVLLLNHFTFGFDQPWLVAAESLRGNGLIWQILSETANIPLIVSGFGIIIWLFVTHRRREAVVVAILLIAVTAGSEGFKQLVARPRPEGTDPNIPGVVYSYPSGHELEALVIWGVIAIHALRNSVHPLIAWGFVVFAIVDVFLVGLSRVVLATHYPSDVIASIFGGAGALAIYGLLSRHWAEQTRDHGP